MHFISQKVQYILYPRQVCFLTSIVTPKIHTNCSKLYLQQGYQKERHVRLAKGFCAFYAVFWTVPFHCSPKRIPLHNIIEFGDLIWGWEAIPNGFTKTVFLLRQTSDTKEKLAFGLPYTLYYQHSSLISSIYFKENQLQWRAGRWPSSDPGNVLFYSQPLLCQTAEFVHLFYVSANTTARKATSTTPNSSPLESHHNVC